MTLSTRLAKYAGLREMTAMKFLVLFTLMISRVYGRLHIFAHALCVTNLREVSREVNLLEVTAQCERPCQFSRSLREDKLRENL